MFKKEEKKPIVKILLGFFFLDLAYEGKWKLEIIELLWLFLSIDWILVEIPPSTIWQQYAGWILFLILLKRKGQRIINYAKEYVEA